MPKMKAWNGTTWVVLDAKDATTVAGKTPGAVNGIATLDANGKLTASQAQSSVNLITNPRLRLI